MPIKPVHLDELLFGYEKPEDLLAEEGLFKQLKKALLERSLVADTSLPGRRVVRELDVLLLRRGRPLSCVSDNGTELTSMAILRAGQ
jgi:hypothetical protein